MNNVKELLRKHGYVTVIQKMEDGCVIVYPHPKLINELPRLVESFALKRGENSGFVVSTSFDTEGQLEKFIPVPEYAMRIYIVTEMISCNMMINLSPQMVIYLDENQEECDYLSEIIGYPSNDEETSKENVLLDLIREAREKGFPAEYDDIAESKGVGLGYGLIRKFYN